MIRPERHSMLSVLAYGVFLLSGAAGLLYETLWFRQVGLLLGNGVWATSIVLASFMGGLALGNGWAARRGDGIQRPLLAYASIEAVIGVVGVSLVVALPSLDAMLGPTLTPLLDRPVLLNGIRVLVAFGLLVVPTTAMGASLPLMVRALRGMHSTYGATLGALYGCNTFGATVGAIVGEFHLIERFGVRGTGWLAALTNLLAAGIALYLEPRVRRSVSSFGAGAAGARASIASPGDGAADSTEGDAFGRGRTGRLLAAAALSGGILLGLEVVWFRYLQLFFVSTSRIFAAMLALVLIPIALGGLAAGRWLHSRRLDHLLPSLALSSGVLVIIGYVAHALLVVGRTGAGLGALVTHALALMFPVSFVSGVLFTAIGAAIQHDSGTEAKTTGLLTVANTAGSAVGALLGGFVLLPVLGIEKSLVAAAVAYALVAVLVSTTVQGLRDLRREIPLTMGVAMLGLAPVFFPFGALSAHSLDVSTAPFRGDGARIATVREGRTETAILLRSDFLGRPMFYRLLTNGFSMSGTRLEARRYMKLFVYLPVALHPSPKDALLISYGVGSTAKALTDTSSLRSIDVVDISRGILDLSEVIFPETGENPLEDPRVKVFVEDGRFFMRTSEKKYDVITGEPPPPKHAHVGNLYSKEYFELAFERLRPGGVMSYWAPLQLMSDGDLRAIVKAFCDVFAECSLWLGSDMDWILLGVREPFEAPTSEAFRRQWGEPRVASELRTLGVESPEQLGALFVADAEGLHALTAGTEPLVDDFPYRISPVYGGDPIRLSQSWVAAEPSVERFRTSRHVARLWPPDMIQRSAAAFEWRELLYGMGQPPSGFPSAREPTLSRVHRVLTRSPLESLVLFLLGTNEDQLRILDEVGDGAPSSGVRALLLAKRALAARDFERAGRLYREIYDPAGGSPWIAQQTSYALAMAGHLGEAQAIAEHERARGNTSLGEEEWRFLEETFFAPRDPAGGEPG